MNAIEFDRVGKQYRLGRVGTGTLQHDLNRWFQTSILGREDPYLKIGETNDRTTKGHSDYVWALKDISFEVEQGDVVGIIGKNGAGKSTLLKLLSHITAPTTGNISYRGRIASLLEVGTGFHPEMTGRENIYMNGSIMGMTKAEITRKLDEIVDFAGVERYLDTPVKRYSSGMTVRLGFAVAAFLEPEILVVDEVLTVGDAEFQKKAIGKMQDVSQHGGRTVLFVSHNMDSMLNLCNNGVLLENGIVKYRGDIRSTVATYLGGNNNEHHFHQETSKFEAFISDVYIGGTEEQKQGMISFNESLCLHVSIIRKEACVIDSKAVLSIIINTIRNTVVSMVEIPIPDLTRKGVLHFSIKYPSSLLMPNQYIVLANIHVPNIRGYDYQETISFNICDNGSEFIKYEGRDTGIILLRPEITIQ
jgi:lipopolysaccharide transport system ATP-binding protein